MRGAHSSRDWAGRWFLLNPFLQLQRSKSSPLRGGEFFGLCSDSFFIFYSVLAGKGLRSAKVKLSGDRWCRADEPKLEIEEKQNGSFDQRWQQAAYAGSLSAPSSVWTLTHCLLRDYFNFVQTNDYILTHIHRRLHFILQDARFWFF